MRYLSILLLITLCGAQGCGEGLMPGSHKRMYGGMDAYKAKLEEKLLRKYRNHPVYGERVHHVELEVVRDIQIDLDGKRHKVEWAQLVFDHWNKRIPALEKEFFVVVFADEEEANRMGYRKVYQAKPSLTVGLKARGSAGEHRSVRSQPLQAGHARHCPGCGTKGTFTGLCASCLKSRPVPSTTATAAAPTQGPGGIDRARLRNNTALRARERLDMLPAPPQPQYRVDGRLVPPSGSELTSTLPAPQGTIHETTRQVPMQVPQAAPAVPIVPPNAYHRRSQPAAPQPQSPSVRLIPREKQEVALMELLGGKSTAASPRRAMAAPSRRASTPLPRAQVEISTPQPAHELPREVQQPSPVAQAIRRAEINLQRVEAKERDLSRILQDRF